LLIEINTAASHLPPATRRMNAVISDGGLSTNAASVNQQRGDLDVDLSDTTKSLSTRPWRRAQVPR
jgi:hypothetical protein